MYNYDCKQNKEGTGYELGLADQTLATMDHQNETFQSMVMTDIYARDQHTLDTSVI